MAYATTSARGANAPIASFRNLIQDQKHLGEVILEVEMEFWLAILGSQGFLEIWKIFDF